MSSVLIDPLETIWREFQLYNASRKLLREKSILHRLCLFSMIVGLRADVKVSLQFNCECLLVFRSSDVVLWFEDLRQETFYLATKGMLYIMHAIIFFYHS